MAGVYSEGVYPSLSSEEETVAVYRIEPERATLHGKFSREFEPVLTIELGIRSATAPWMPGGGWTVRTGHARDLNHVIPSGTPGMPSAAR